MKTESRSWSFTADHVANCAVYHDVFPLNDLDKIIEYGKSYDLENAKLANGVENTDYRKNKSAFLAPRNYNGLYRRLTDVCMILNNEYFKFDVFGFMEGLQFTEYNAPGDYYDEHMDKLYSGLVRKLTFVLQLTDSNEYDGCDLELITGGRDVAKMKRDRGTLIMFPSYILHRVTPITRGTRHSLVGWITGAPFK